MAKYIKIADRGRLETGPLDHGTYSVRHRSQMMASHPEILQYVNAVRRGVLKDICPEGPEHLTVARQVILDRCLRKLSTALLIEASLTEDKVRAGVPVTRLWMDLNKQIRDDLKLLGLDRKSLEAEVLSPQELLLDAAKDAELEDKAQEGKGEGGDA